MTLERQGDVPTHMELKTYHFHQKDTGL